ncbi:MAG: hypothetical protein HXY44_11975 [Syntrophaceae bacterium]|nr:hypothetical protein [Syntrophaceae bacterium]
MSRPSHRKPIDEIASIVHNRPLASAIYRSVASGLDCPFVHLVSCRTVYELFKRSLDSAIRDIEEHPKGKLFQRLIEYGPHNPDVPESLISDHKTTLSDPECGTCVEFIYSHMVNRFKGELAELLAIDPCIALIQQLRRKGHLPSDVQLFWGEMIQERRKVKTKEGNLQWGSFTKGADGLLAEEVSDRHSKSFDTLKVLGIVEVKSMSYPMQKVATQINSHIMRLRGGIKLEGKEWTSNHLSVAPINTPKKKKLKLARIMVVPSTWKLSREWHSVKADKGREIVLPEPSETQLQARFEELESNLWKITLPWSVEGLNQASYEMTFWYMSQVGSHVYKNKTFPKGWEYMTPKEAGYNAIKMMLYYIPLRYISTRQGRLATRLYNVYCFGYPLGADSKEMLWPDNFPYREKK